MALRSVHRLQHLLGADAQPLGDVIDGGARPSREGSSARAFSTLRICLELARMDRPATVAEMALQLPEDGGDGEGREGAALGVEAHTALTIRRSRPGPDRRMAQRPRVARGEASSERHEALDQLLAHRRGRVLGVAPQQRPLVRKLLVGAGRGGWALLEAFSVMGPAVRRQESADAPPKDAWRATRLRSSWRARTGPSTLQS